MRPAASVVLLPPAMPLMAAPRDALLHRLAGRSMGTGWQLALAGPRSFEPSTMRERVQRVLDEVDRQMSHWRGDSELARFNRLTAGEWLGLSPDFDAVMRLASATRSSAGASVRSRATTARASGRMPGRHGPAAGARGAAKRPTAGDSPAKVGSTSPPSPRATRWTRW